MRTGTNTCRRCGAPIPSGALGGNCPRCLAALALSTTTPGAPSAGPSSGEAAEPFRPARFFGDYEILGELARGGMGVVYRARHVSLNRPVALKMIAAGQLATPGQVQRFRLEGEAAARLDHPNIVPIYEVGEHQGQHFYSMKLIEGGTLAKSEVRGARSEPGVDFAPRTSALLLLKVVRAIHYAHQHGILHRDLKPTNILVDAGGEPHITDFGLAKLVDDDNSLTQTIEVLGTPAYMAPELASGKAAEATTAADIYSLGAILYYLLAGRPPFAAENIPALLRKIVEEEPVRPSAAQSEIGTDHVAFALSVPADLEIIALKCLEKDPLRRYTSARALAEDLEHWLAGEPILARPAGAVERFGRWCRRKPAFAALWGGLAVALVAGICGVAWQWRRAEANALNARLEAENARRAETNATAQLWRSLLAQAQAERRTGEMGQRQRALEAVMRAGALRPALELRNEAIAALALTDLRFVPMWNSPYTTTVTDFTPGLTRFVVATASGRIRLFSTSDVAEEDPFPAVLGVGNWAHRLRFSPDERFVAANYTITGSNIVWEVATRKPVLTWGPSRMPGEFTPDGQRLLAVEDSGLVRCVSLPGGQELWRSPINAQVWGLEVEPRQKYFAAYWEGKWDVEVRAMDSGEVVRTLTHPSPVGMFSWCPDGKHLVVGAENGGMYLWDVDSEAEPETWKGHEDAVAALAFAPTGEWLVSGSWDGSVRLWKWPERSLAVMARGYKLSGPRFSSDGRWLAGALRGPVLGQFEVSTNVAFRRFPVALGDRRGAWSLDVSPDGKLVAASYGDGVRLFDFATGRELAFHAVGHCRSVIFTPDGNGLLTCGSAGLARWPMERMGSPTQVQFGPREVIRGNALHYASLTGDGRWVAAADYSQDRVVVHEVSNPTNRFSFSNHAKIQHVAFSPDGRWVASSTWNGRAVKIWDVASRRLAKELPMGRAMAIFSPDSRLMATSSDRFRVWEVGTWRELYHTSETTEPVQATAFSLDGRTLATTTDSRVVQLLEADTGRVLTHLETPGAVPLHWLRFTPDGASLLALESTRGIQVWDLRRLRGELATLKLDWDAPPHSAVK